MCVSACVRAHSPGQRGAQGVVGGDAGDGRVVVRLLREEGEQRAHGDALLVGQLVLDDRDS